MSGTNASAQGQGAGEHTLPYGELGATSRLRAASEAGCSETIASPSLGLSPSQGKLRYIRRP